jgi:cytochrome P450
MTEAHPVEFDPYDPALTDPTVWETYEAVREGGAVAHSDARGGFYLLGRFDDVRSVLRDPDTFSSAHGHRIPTDGTQKSLPIDFDPPLHTAYRSLMSHALDPGRVRALRPFLRTCIEALVAEFVDSGGGDFVSAVALPLPLQVLVEIVGFAPDTVARFRQVTEDLWSGLGEVTFADAAAAIYALMHAEIAAHRASRPDDYVTWLLDARIDDRPLRDDEIAGTLASLAVAGHETTMNSASTLVHLLAVDPHLQAAVRADPARAGDCVEEMLRLRSPAQNFARRTTRDVEIGGTAVPAGSAVLLSYAAANRDPRQFPRPDEFDLDRATRRHLAFGWGIHLCVGSALARTELTLLLETLVRYPPFRLDGDVTFGSLQGGNHLGPTRLPLIFT